MGLSGRVPLRVDAATKAGLLDLVDGAVEAGWTVRAACKLLGVGEIRTHRWVGRRAAGRLADKTPGGSPLHGLLPGEVEQILAFVRRVGRDRQVASQARAPRLLPASGVGVAVERPAGPFRCRQVLPAAAEAG